MTVALVEFVKARFDEDEQAAKALTTAAKRIGAEPDFYSAGGPAAEAHWRRHDPARVLAEVDAKRRIIDLHEMDWRERPERGIGEADDPYCVACFGEGYPCTTLRLLALPYAGHEKFQEEWRV